ncbi:DASH complex subunit Spc34 [Schizosaccharomyces cryophilus OY26]|uniref:DASH complex subunit SPC34 n=1 Tax=Schizosaccharomyces cryophilus (strain OY26 / ATCC MYA-4695 / CBS 11777 / NBRC 106824 / NRRL Y48691) TaxID=653667 RepID=S9VZD6_SCHCR|nr:DASH complex subunit Spc34 [Schizosaccharomyces cryophilus OY26]EPY52998.1 DASH complex subunit Spc34 [Schizosaccharomyces cryophilus OY26]
MAEFLKHLNSISVSSERLIEPEQKPATRFTDALLHVNSITDLIRDAEKEELITAEATSLPKGIEEKFNSESPADHVACIEELLDIYPMQGGREYLEALVEKYNTHMTSLENLERVLIEQKERLHLFEQRQKDQVSARENILQRENSEIQRLENEIERVKLELERYS